MRKLKHEDKQKMNDLKEDVPKRIARLGPSLFLSGELSGDEDLVIEGQLHGKIDLRNHNLVAEQGSKLNAEIRGGNITIKGDVEGNIYASGRVLISREGYMKGDINAPRISIMDGAQFKGSVKMEKEKSDTTPFKIEKKPKDSPPPE